MGKAHKHVVPKESLWITWVGIFINIFLCIFKIVFGFLMHSRALVGDGLHSLLDLSTDLVALFGLKMSAVPEDEKHPYGHYKFSSLSTLFISIILLVFCLGLIGSSLHALFLGKGEMPHWPAIVVAAISVVMKEGLFWKTRAVAKKTRSRLLMANAWHHRYDSLTSVAVVVSIGIILIGGPKWIFLDQVLGLFMGVYLGYQGFKIFIEACEDLLDTAPGTEMINDLREHILPTEGALGYHDFRARRVGDFFEVDMHLQVEPGTTVEEGHIIASKVKQNIIKQHPEVIDVLVHIEPAIDRHLKESGVHEIGTEE